MNLRKKKELASRALEVGEGRIVFNNSRIDEIKEAITKQDIRDLVAAGAISVREIKGRKAIVRRTSRRKAGSIKKPTNPKKRGYIIITRKLRSYLAGLKKSEKVSKEQYEKLRKEIRGRMFKSKAQFKERLAIKQTK
jgi:large subunit ribosomal protein L19e